MRLLLDTCVWGGVCKELQAQGAPRSISIFRLMKNMKDGKV